MTRSIRLMAVAALLAMSTAAMAQDNPPQPRDMIVSLPQAATRAQPPLVPLKVTLVFARYQGEKKLSSVPYTLFVTANLPERTSLRVGNQVPVATTVLPAMGGAPPQSSYNYREVGTNIDCAAQTGPDGFYRITLTVADSSVAYAEGDAASRTAPPTFRSFNSTFNILLRDGQTVQYTSAADAISGQVVKLDATVNVQK